MQRGKIPGSQSRRRKASHPIIVHQKASDLLRLFILACIAAAITWLAAITLRPVESFSPTVTENIPNQGSNSAIAAQGSGTQRVEVPKAVGTEQLPILEDTPTQPLRPATSTPVALQAAMPLTPTLVSNLTTDAATNIEQQSAIDRPEPLRDLTWAPTGDKLIYVTKSKKLYWSNTDGSNATLLHTDDEVAGSLTQRPTGNTLILTHLTSDLTQNHMDVVHFTSGQAPTLTTVNTVGAVFSINWWSPDRASGTQRGSYTGGDKLITFDSSGQVVEQRNIPYMLYGAVQPGGAWLAYTTNQQTTYTSFYGSDPETAYLLNLNTGQRLQISQTGKGYRVYNWSPDGNWVLLDGCYGSNCGTLAVSADGQEVVVIRAGSVLALSDAVWSPNSRHLAFSVQLGGCDSGAPCTPLTSDTYLIDVPARKISTLSSPGSQAYSVGQTMHPRWAPDGSILTLLSFDPNCFSDGPCSSLTPAYYIMSMTTK